jgi:prepilin-type N-terminal cleavage/methylation domain-containing protein
MREGFTLTELAVGLLLVAILTGIGLPRLGRTLDWIAADAAARDVTTALAVTRATAAMHGIRTRLVITADSLRLDRWEEARWLPVRRWPGPASRGVTLEVSNPEVTFDPLGLGWGVSNTRVVVRRGRSSEMVTVSVVGRVKRW